MSYLEFHESGTSESGKTKIWDVYNFKFSLLLGIVKWYAPWRKYLFFPDPHTAYDSGCLGVIKDFIDNEMRMRKDGDNLINHKGDPEWPASGQR